MKNSADHIFSKRLYSWQSCLTDRISPASGPRARSSLLSNNLSNKVYANVIVDIQSTELKDKLFTYEIPEELVPEAFIGAHVLVPFGSNKLIGGLILALGETYDGQIKSIKKVAEVVEVEPLFDKDYVEFLYWIADYYCARVADVIAAAIPASFSPRFKKIVSLVDEQSAKDAASRSIDPMVRMILMSLTSSKHHTLAMSTVKQKCKRLKTFSSAQFYKTINSLRVEGVVKTSEEKSAGTVMKTVSAVMLTEVEPVGARQTEIVSILQKEGGQMLLKDLIAAASTTHATVKKLCTAGLLKGFEIEDVRDPLAYLTANKQKKPSPFTLTDEQGAAFNVLSNAMDESFATFADATSQHNAEPWLLHGVTGSGKTEVYLRLIEKTLELKRSAILLVPEISLTPQSARRLTERFGTLVAIWHSGLSAGEKYDTWRKLRMGEVRILLGARSAILSSLPDLGLIILDEEHDSSYKQSSPSPRYSAKELAIERARRTGALVVFGSATPDLVAYKTAKANGRYVQLINRVHKQAMPTVQIVDMRIEFQRGNKSIFSQLLLEKLSETLKKKEQAILLMNRRGFASHVFCRACGYVARCKNCSVSLVFHQSGVKGANPREDYARGHLACHHCGFSCSSIFECPACRSPFIRQMGMGTQRIETEVKELFPSARVVRLDSDVTTKKGSHDEILQNFAHGNADVLIGTQMVAKGLDIANVTMIGVVAADSAFNMPDYRSTERGFQLLTQVSGRTGRGDKAGEVVWQTYNTEMPVLAWAKTHDFSLFAEEEIRAREAFNYPPFSQLIRVVVAGNVVTEVEQACDVLAEKIATFLADEYSEEAIQILGPAPCILERLRGKYRFHLLIKNFIGAAGHKAITGLLRDQRMPEGIIMAVDVDALDLL
jgi:primosomal protein N' (replication factor Y)